VRRSEYGDRIGEYDELVSQRAAPAASRSMAEIENEERYERLSERIDELEAELDDYRGEFTADGAFPVLIRDAGPADYIPGLYSPNSSRMASQISPVVA